MLTVCCLIGILEWCNSNIVQLIWPDYQTNYRTLRTDILEALILLSAVKEIKEKISCEHFELPSPLTVVEMHDNENNKNQI